MITKQEIKKIAKLARLDLSEKETEKFQKDLSGILDYFNSLKKAPKFKIKAPAHAKASAWQRKDEARLQSDSVAKKIIEAAPDKKDNYVKVNPVRNDWG